ncbi:MAG TPA: cupin domain-containing protein [bacterium]|nr:cupin domain-containing protein [bacterium]
MTADDLIKLLGLKPHPEGGYYRESYRSSAPIPASNPQRVYSTAIYYMLVPGAVSKLHRLSADEVFHFYMGDPVTWVLLAPGGKVERIILGQDIKKGHLLQMVVPAGTWFGGYLNEGGKFALMGTTVAPGFEFEDFVLGKREELLKAFPRAEKEIFELT